MPPVHWAPPPSLAKRPERRVGGASLPAPTGGAAYVLYDRSGQSVSLFVTRRLPFAQRGGPERQVDGAEVYFASLRGVALILWEEKRADRNQIHAAVFRPSLLDDVMLSCLAPGLVAAPDLPSP